MKYPGLIFTTLALSYSVANAADTANDSTYSNGILHIPHAKFKDLMYDVKMKYLAPETLILQSAKPLQTMPDNPVVEVSDKLTFKLTDIATTELTYRADVELVESGNGIEYKASEIFEAIYGKMIEGEKITALGFLADGSFSYAYGISDNGSEITGRSRNDESKTVPVKFHVDEGRIEALNGFAGGRDEGRSINNNGTLAGFGNIEPDKEKPRIYNAFYNKTDKDLVKLGTLGGMDSRAYGINNNDKIVGWSSSNADNSDHVAFSHDGTTMTALGGDILGGARSFAFDINDSDQIVGVATTEDGSALAFLYENGEAKDLGSLDDSGYSEARAINDKGHSTGWSLSAEGTYAAYIHDGTTMIKIPGLGGDSKGFDINTHGHVVGDARDADGGRHAFLYKDGELIDLYDLLPEADKAKWKELREAFSISDDGVIVGRGKYWRDKAIDEDTTMAFRLKL